MPKSLFPPPLRLWTTLLIDKVQGRIHQKFLWAQVYFLAVCRSTTTSRSKYKRRGLRRSNRRVKFLLETPICLAQYRTAIIYRLSENILYLSTKYKPKGSVDVCPKTFLPTQLFTYIFFALNTCTLYNVSLFRLLCQPELQKLCPPAKLSIITPRKNCPLEKPTEHFSDPL